MTGASDRAPGHRRRRRTVPAPARVGRSRTASVPRLRRHRRRRLNRTERCGTVCGLARVIFPSSSPLREQRSYVSAGLLASCCSSRRAAPVDQAISNVTPLDTLTRLRRRCREQPDLHVLCGRMAVVVEEPLDGCEDDIARPAQVGVGSCRRTRGGRRHRAGNRTRPASADLESPRGGVRPTARADGGARVHPEERALAERLNSIAATSIQTIAW